MKIDKYEIEKGIPIPPAEKELRMDTWRTIAKNMEVGNSIKLGFDEDYREPMELFEELKYEPLIRKIETGFRIWRTT